MQQSFFDFESGGFPATVNSGAEFSADRKYRYALWRIWENKKPIVMFIGLNPSTANEQDPDRTVSTVIRYAKRWGYGGVYMMNCFPYVSTDPEKLYDHSNTDLNDRWLRKVGEKCERVVFAWGAFKIIREKKRDIELTSMFPDAVALVLNKDGSPHHPLYLPPEIVPVKWEYTLQTS